MLLTAADVANAATLCAVCRAPLRKVHRTAFLACCFDPTKDGATCGPYWYGGWLYTDPRSPARPMPNRGRPAGPRIAPGW